MYIKNTNNMLTRTNSSLMYLQLTLIRECSIIIEHVTHYSHISQTNKFSAF